MQQHGMSLVTATPGLPISLKKRYVPPIVPATNLFSQSSNFSDPAWSKTGLTIVEGTPERLQETAVTSSVHLVSRDIALDASTAYHFVFRGAADGRNIIFLQVETDDYGTGVSGFYNLSTGAFISGGPFNANFKDGIYNISNVGGNVYECTLGFKVPASGNYHMTIALYNGTTSNYLGDTLNGVLATSAALYDTAQLRQPLLIALGDRLLGLIGARASHTVAVTTNNIRFELRSGEKETIAFTDAADVERAQYDGAITPVESTVRIVTMEYGVTFNQNCPGTAAWMQTFVWHQTSETADTQFPAPLNLTFEGTTLKAILRRSRQNPLTTAPTATTLWSTTVNQGQLYTVKHAIRSHPTLGQWKMWWDGALVVNHSGDVGYENPILEYPIFGIYRASTAETSIMTFSPKPVFSTEIVTAITPPAYVAAGTRAHANAATLTPALPTGTGNLIIAYCGSENNAVHSTATSGWTKGSQTNSGAGFTASWFWALNPAAAPVITWTGSTVCGARCYRFSGAHTSGPIGAYSVNSGSIATHSSASITTTAAGSHVIYLDFVSANTSLATPAGWTQYSSSGNGTFTTANTVGGKDVTTLGATSGAISITGSANPWVQSQLELLAG